MKVRKKPIMVEAELYKPGMEDGFAIFIGYNIPDNAVTDGKGGIAYIDTLEGRHMICHGDYIITGVKGERYPIKPDIFNATYEIIEE